MHSKAKLLILGSIANVFEWYDYALFGHFAILIGNKFFPSGDPALALIKSFLLFAVGYLIRPIGGTIFGVVGDRFGRRTALSLAIVCMSVPTMLIGMLPTYSDIGITAAVLLVIARVMQGLSMGGALTGSIAFMIEHASPGIRGFVGSLSMAGAGLGILSGSIVVGAIRLSMSVESFESWGWRVPFIIGVLILAVGLYIKKHMAETPAFEEVEARGVIEKSPVRKVLKRHWWDMLCTVMLDSLGCVIFYIGAVYSLSFFKNRGFSDTYIWCLTAGCNLLTAVSTVFAGWLSDKVGRRRIMAVAAVITIFVTPLIMGFFDTDSTNMVMCAQILLTLLAAVYLGPEPALLVEFYPANVRSTALSLSYNVSASIFAGATPYFVALIVKHTGKMFYATWYVEVCAVMSLVGLAFYKNRSSIIK